MTTSKAAQRKARSKPDRREISSEAFDDADHSSPLEKVFGVLQLLAYSHGPMSLSDIASGIGMPKTTVHRIIAQLERMGFLQKEPGSRNLVISASLVQLGLGIVGTSFRTGQRHEIVKLLSRTLNESVVVGMRVGHEIVYVDDAAQEAPLMLRFRAGLRAPLHCTSMGKLYLARMTEQEWAAFASLPLQRFTEHTITDPAKLHREVLRVRKDDFATSNQELIRGVIGAASPIIRADGKMIAAVSASAPAVRFTMAQIQDWKPVLSAAAAELADTFAANAD